MLKEQHYGASYISTDEYVFLFCIDQTRKKDDEKQICLF